MCASHIDEYDYEYVVEDPAYPRGPISMDDSEAAFRYADAVGGEVYLRVWHDGSIVDTQLVSC